jgi:hypothetical protein
MNINLRNQTDWQLTVYPVLLFLFSELQVQAQTFSLELHFPNRSLAHSYCNFQYRRNIRRLAQLLE